MKEPFYEGVVRAKLFDVFSMEEKLRKTIAGNGRDFDWVILTFTPDVKSSTVKITMTDKELE